jgi:hypothetical protein
VTKSDGNFKFIFPLVADGFNSVALPKYIADKTQNGGVWAGKKAIVVFCDTSGQIMKCDATTLVPQRTFSDGTKGSLFDDTKDTTNWLGTSNLTVDSE